MKMTDITLCTQAQLQTYSDVTTHTHGSLLMADIRDRAVQGDPVADVNIESVFPVGLVDPVCVRQGERLPLLTVTFMRQRQSPP